MLEVTPAPDTFTSVLTVGLEQLWQQQVKGQPTIQPPSLTCAEGRASRWGAASRRRGRRPCSGRPAGGGQRSELSSLQRLRTVAGPGSPERRMRSEFRGQEEPQEAASCLPVEPGNRKQLRSSSSSSPPGQRTTPPPPRRWPCSDLTFDPAGAAAEQHWTQREVSSEVGQRSGSGSGTCRAPAGGSSGAGPFCCGSAGC